MIAYLFLPRKAQPPLQTVVYFPGSGAIDLRSSDQLEMPFIDFVIKSGRAVLYPVYKGTYERGDDLKSDYPDTSSSWRDHVIAWSKDLGRSIDYLETRPEIDTGRLAYEGLSWGGAMGSLLPALEDRIKACVLIVPGFNLQKSLPEADELNFAPRVKVPVLMLNGRFDFFYPMEASQEPMFRLLGTPKRQQTARRVRDRAQRSPQRSDQGSARLAGPLPGPGEHDVAFVLIAETNAGRDRSRPALAWQLARARSAARRLG